MLARVVATSVLIAAQVGATASAGPALLFDAANGKVLYAEDHDHQWHPASLTKIMTAYVVLEALKSGKFTLATKISYSRLASIQPPTKVGLAVGARISVKKALQALIIESANDIAVMLAEATAGTHKAFVERMNATAIRLGMSRTKFVNAHGLPDAEQVTTARDLARLARAVLRDYPDHAHLWSLPDVWIGKRHFGTFNGLLAKYAGADGMKTGFTCDSGFNIVASATREGHKLIAVVLGENTGSARTLRASRLLDHGFQSYSWKTLFPSDSIDTLPMDDDASGPTTIRQSVISWVCGTARRPVAKLNRNKGVVAAQGDVAKKVSRSRKAAAKASSMPSWVPW